MTSLANSDEQGIEEVENFQTLAGQMHQTKLPLLLVLRREECTYCRQLEENELEPLLKNGQHLDRILIRQLTVSKEWDITDFNGDKITARQFSQKYHVSLTPTVLFLNNQGMEVAEALQGYSSPDFYGAYLERAIEQAKNTVQQPDP